MAPIDIVEAESEVARNEESVIVAEAEVGRAEDRVRALVFDPDAPDFWSTQIQPSDSPVLRAREIDVAAAVWNALDNRTDLGTLDKNIDNTDTDISYYRNQRLPDVNLEVNYSLSGLGGSRLVRTGGFPGTIVGEEQTSFGSVLGDIFGNNFPNWTVGGQCGVPPGHQFCRCQPRARAAAAQPGSGVPPKPRGAGRNRGSGCRPQRDHEFAADRGDRGGASVGRTPARGGAAKIRGRHVHELLRVPGPARPGPGTE